ncbi:unnamed protein product [Gemmataceae bacterium]|nr:unnamed protein product [Gemmataceae bacterium]VTT97978.1 unnamed protein product [Gemmataceae bacterium]
MRVNTRTLLRRLDQIEKRVPVARVLVWDVITGHASPDDLTGLDRQIWERMEATSDLRNLPCPVEVAIGSVRAVLPGVILPPENPPPREEHDDR